VGVDDDQVQGHHPLFETEIPRSGVVQIMVRLETAPSIAIFKSKLIGEITVGSWTQVISRNGTRVAIEESIHPK
jgi:hypothetical protein